MALYERIVIASCIVLLHLFQHQRFFADAQSAGKNFECRSNCCDKHEFCRFWSSIGECENNRAWMTPNCQLTCNACSVVDSAFRIPREPPTVPDSPAPAVQLPQSLQQPQAQQQPPTSGSPSGSPSGRGVKQGVNNPQRCTEIRKSFSADVQNRMKNEGLVIETEDSTFRRVLSTQDIINSNNQQGCAPQQENTDCGRNACFNSLFRTMDGTCNNFDNPMWGAAALPFIRLKPPAYDDGVAAPTGSIKGGRPSAREASRFLLSSPQAVESNRWNSLLMQFGQFIVHDISKTSVLPTDQCIGCTEIPGRCFPIRVEPFDQRFGCQQPPCCLSFTRASPVCGLQPRIRLNENTAYIDGSHVYGSSPGDANRLRDGFSGFLRTTFFNNRVFMPFNTGQCQGPTNCRSEFDTGDNRVAIFVGLAALHTLFLREHNRLAQQLQQRNPAWSGDRVYQEARKIVGAELQALTFKQFLPKMLGNQMNALIGDYREYNPKVNPSVADEFASGAMRFGHGMVHETFPRQDANGQSVPEGDLRVDDGVLRPHKLIFEGGVDGHVRGLMTKPLKRPQRLTTALTERMFGGADLGAINIQRGRDAGLPSYNEWREFCGLKKAKNFDDLKNEILDQTVRNNLQQGYLSPDNIDLYVAALLEDPVVDGMVGPTVACLISEQFKRIRDGDRLWYQNPGIFTAEQLAELEKVTMARIVCDNGDNFQFVPKDAFELTTGSNLVPCNNIPSMDLRKWSD